MRTFYSIPPSGRGIVVFYFDINEWVFQMNNVVVIFNETLSV